MKNAACKAFMLAGVLLLMSSAAIAGECSGEPWRFLQNYVPGSGGACAALGLSEYQAVCQPGEPYALYCDDGPRGRYRVCQSNIPCPRQGYGEYRHDRHDDRWRDRWDERRDRWDDRRDRWDDRRDDYWRNRNDPRYEHRERPFDCTQWDYDANRPCPAGTVNRDCRNSCDGR